MKSHNPTSKPKRKEVHTQIEKHSPKTHTINQMNSFFPNRWSFSYPNKEQVVYTIFMSDIPYFFCYKTEFFRFQNNLKNLDLYYKTNLDLWDCSGRMKPILQQNLIGLILLFVVILERGKNLSYSRINMVHNNCYWTHLIYIEPINKSLIKLKLKNNLFKYCYAIFLQVRHQLMH